MCDHCFQYAWRGTTASGYWIQKCQRCGMEKCVESEDDYYTGSQLDNAVIEYTVVNQTRFTELEAERDALRAELAGVKADLSTLKEKRIAEIFNLLCTTCDRMSDCPIRDTASEFCDVNKFFCGLWEARE